MAEKFDMTEVENTNDLKPHHTREAIVKDFEALQTSITANHQITPEEDARIRRKIDAWLLPVMAVAYMFQFLDKTCLSYAAILGIREDLHLTASEYSWAGSIYYFGYLIAAYPIAGIALVRLPVAKVINVSLLVWGAILMFTALCFNAGGLLAVRTFLGIAESAIAPGLTIIVSMWYKREEQPLRQGAWFLGNCCAGLFGGLVGYGIGHIEGFPAWKVVFLVFGGATVVLSLVAFYLLPDTPLNAHWLTKEERALAVIRVERNMTGIKSNQWKRYQTLEALCEIKTWCLLLYQLAGNIPNNGIITFGTIVIQGFGFSTLNTILCQMLMSAFQIVFVLITAVGSGFFKNSRTWFMAGNMIISIAGLLLVILLPRSAPWGKMMGICLALCYTANFPMALAMATSNYGGFSKKSTVSGLIFVFYCAGNIIGPNLFFPKDAPDYKPAFIGFIVCFGVGMFAILALRFNLTAQNKERDTVNEVLDISDAELNFLDMTDKEIPQFRYIY